MTYNDELYHYGVLGMKWGIHRAKVNEKKAGKYSSKAKLAADAGDSAKSDKYLAKAAKASKKSTYTYRSHSTKKYQNKSARIQKKLDSKNLSDKKRLSLEIKKAKYDYRAERSSTLDSREQAYAARVKVGGNIAMRLLTAGNIGGKSYQQYIAMADAQGKGNWGAKFIAQRNNKRNSKMVKNVLRAPNKKVRDPLTGRISSSLEKAAYLRTGEKDYLDELKKKR